MKNITCINISGFNSYIKEFETRKHKIIVVDRSFNLKNSLEKSQFERKVTKTLKHEDISCIDFFNLCYPNHPGPDSIAICGRNSLLLADNQSFNSLNLKDPNIAIKRREKYYQKLSRKNEKKVFQNSLLSNELKLLKKYKKLMLHKEDISDEELGYIYLLVEMIFNAGTPIKENTFLRKK